MVRGLVRHGPIVVGRRAESASSQSLFPLRIYYTRADVSPEVVIPRSYSARTTRIRTRTTILVLIKSRSYAHVPMVFSRAELHAVCAVFVMRDAYMVEFAQPAERVGK